jgi:ferrous iron transport protein B
MSSCCETSDLHATPPSSTTLTIALAGNPNSGKTTIFNALTGLRQKVANYPGVTVEKKTGRLKLDDGRVVDVIDLPGTYSLISRSPDETVAMEVLRGLRADTKRPDVVVVVVDASNLQRNLYLVSQLIEMGRPLVVALNMMDVAHRRGIDVSPQKLEAELLVPVVPVVAHKRQGIDELRSAIAKAAVAPMPDWPLPEAMKEELTLVGGGIAILDSDDSSPSSPSPGTPGDGRGEGLSRMTRDAVHEEGPHPTLSRSTGRGNELGMPSKPRAWICLPDHERRLDRYQAIAERLLIGDRAPDVSKFIDRQPVSALLAAAQSRLAQLGIDPMQADVEAHYQWIEGIAQKASMTLDELAAIGTPAPATTTADDAPVLDYQSKPRHLSERIDAILIHKVWGLVIFAAIMATLFVSIFWLASPLMDALQSAVTWAGSLASSRLPDGPVKALITDGIFKGVGAVLVFVPQIALLFMFLAILEDSGYLARAAFLMDRLLAKVGLHGKSFIPLLSSFACAIPGILATRTIENRRDRLATIFIAPFMSCSARLPVYALLIGTYFAGASALVRGGIMLSLYALGIIAAVATAWLFKRTMLKGAPAAFILELPTYKLPQLGQVARQVWMNTSEFVRKAGTIIFCLSVILWAMTYYPRLPESRAQQIGSSVRANPGSLRAALVQQRINSKAAEIERAEGVKPDLVGITSVKIDDVVKQQIDSAQLRNSFAGRFGHLIEPAIRPLGYDWKMGVGLVGAFAAREVFVSTMAITYAAGDEDNTADLATAMRADTYPNGKPVWTPLVATSLLVWFVLAMQCMSTLAIVRRETGGWKWPLFMLAYMNVLAYVVCLAVYQVGRMWFA